MDTLLDTLDADAEAGGANCSVIWPSGQLVRPAPGADGFARYRAACIELFWV